jgi:protein tyrosine phosphatase
MAIPQDRPKVPEELKPATGAGAEAQPQEVVKRTTQAAEKGGLPVGAGTTTVRESKKPISPVPSPVSPIPGSPKVSRRAPQETFASPGFKEKIDTALHKAGDTRTREAGKVKKKLSEIPRGYTKSKEIVNHEKFAGKIVDRSNFDFILSGQKPKIGILYVDAYHEFCLVFKEEGKEGFQTGVFNANDSVEDVCKRNGVTLMEISPEIREDPHFEGFSYLNLLRLEARRVNVLSSEPQAEYYDSAWTMLERVQEEELSVKIDSKEVMPTRDPEWSQLQSNEIRARDKYTNVQPYLHNMVPCAKEDNPQGYLNASFVMAEKRLFLACQGPLKNAAVDTIKDLWSASISNKSKLIVSLGPDIEGEKTKFDKSFFLDDGNEITVETSEGRCKVVQVPENQKPVEIAISGEKETAKFIIREYKITFPDGTAKTMMNCQYLTWTDMSSTSPEALVHLIGYINTECKEPEDAVTTHCSAGIGRTGTLISAYSIDKKIKAGEETISLGAIVTATRAQRYGSVQTKEQFSLLAKYAHYVKKSTE